MKRVASVGLLLLLLTACGGGSDSPGSGAKSGGSSGATTSAATTEAGTGATTDPATSAAVDGKNPVDGTAFCAFLAETAPKLKAIGSVSGAKADFAVETANWIGRHPAQKPRTTADLDDASRQTCPKSRATVATIMGAASLEEALS